MRLTPVTNLLKNALALYFKRENIVYLTKIALAGLLVSLVPLLPMLAVAGGLGFFATGDQMDITQVASFGILSLVFFIIIMVVVMLVQVVQLVAIVNVKRGTLMSVKDTYKAAWPKLGRFFLTALLVGLAVTVGFILFIIPGIIFGIWFAFAPFLAVEDDLGAVEAMKKSKAMVSGLFFPILGRILLFFLLSIIIQMVAGVFPFAGIVITIILSPLFLLVYFMLYQDVRAAKKLA